MKNGKFIEKYLNDMGSLVDKIPREKISNIIEIIFNAWKNDKHIFIMGNGGSASTATHFASDLAKTAGVDGKKRIRSTSLTDNMALVSAWTNDFGFDNAYIGQLENFLNPGDVVIALSVHGGRKDWSNNLLKALEYANKNSASTIALTGFDGGEMKNIVDECLIVPIDSTSHVESYHVALHHLITFALKERIKNE